MTVEYRVLDLVLGDLSQLSQLVPGSAIALEIGYGEFAIPFWDAIGRPTVKVYGKEGAGLRGHRPLNTAGIDVACRRVDIHKNGFRPGVRNRLGGSDQGVGRCDHFIAASDTGRGESEVQRACARVGRYTVFGLNMSGELPLEAVDFFAQNEGGAAVYPVEGVANLLPETAMLSLQIELWNDHGEVGRGSDRHLTC